MSHSLVLKVQMPPEESKNESEFSCPWAVAEEKTSSGSSRLLFHSSSLLDAASLLLWVIDPHTSRLYEFPHRHTQECTLPAPWTSLPGEGDNQDDSFPSALKFGLSHLQNAAMRHCYLA